MHFIFSSTAPQVCPQHKGLCDCEQMCSCERDKRQWRGHLLDVLDHDVLHISDGVARAVDGVCARVMREEVLHSAAHDQAAAPSMVLPIVIVAAAWHRGCRCYANNVSRQLTMRCARTGAKASFKLNASAECASLPCSSRNRCRTSSRKAYGSRRPSGCSPHAQLFRVYPTVESRIALAFAEYPDSASMDIQQLKTWSSMAPSYRRTSSAMHRNVMPSATST